MKKNGKKFQVSSAARRDQGLGVLDIGVLADVHDEVGEVMERVGLAPGDNVIFAVDDVGFCDEARFLDAFQDFLWTTRGGFNQDKGYDFTHNYHHFKEFSMRAE